MKLASVVNKIPGGFNTTLVKVLFGSYGISALTFAMFQYNSC